MTFSLPPLEIPQKEEHVVKMVDTFEEEDPEEESVPEMVEMMIDEKLLALKEELCNVCLEVMASRQH